MEYHFLTLTNSTHTPLITGLVALLVALVALDSKDFSQASTPVKLLVAGVFSLPCISSAVSVLAVTVTASKGGSRCHD